MIQAGQHPEWLQEARIGEHKPETEEYVSPFYQSGCEVNEVADAARQVWDF